MARTKTEIIVTHNRFPEIAAALPEKTDIVVRKTAFDIEARAKMRAAVDTGAMKNSIYVTLGTGESNYTDAVADALDKNPMAAILPEAAKPGEHEALIGPSVEYGPDVEYGTVKMAAQPFMTPAAEEVRDAFKKAMGQMLKEVTEREGR